MAKNLCDAETPGIPRHVLAPQVYEFVEFVGTPPSTFSPLHVLVRVSDASGRSIRQLNACAASSRAGHDAGRSSRACLPIRAPTLHCPIPLTWGI